MASKRALRRKACEGKVQFADANAGYARIRKAQLWGNVPYKCKFCSGFHIGHPPARVRQSMNAIRRNKEM